MCMVSDWCYMWVHVLWRTLHVSTCTFTDATFKYTCLLLRPLRVSVLVCVFRLFICCDAFRPLVLSILVSSSVLIRYQAIANNWSYGASLYQWLVVRELNAHTLNIICVIVLCLLRLQLQTNGGWSIWPITCNKTFCSMRDTPITSEWLEMLLHKQGRRFALLRPIHNLGSIY